MKRINRFLEVPFLLPLLFAGLAIAPGVCLASAFKVTPVKVLLTRRVPTALLTLKNQSDKRLRFQATVFAWDQSPEGRMEITPTEDIVFFPSLLSVEPGEERKVRLASAVPFGARERAYRIFFEELPELEKAGDSKSARLQIRTRMGIPIFLQPKETEKGSRVEGILARAGILRFSVRNTGNVHVNLRGIRVRGLGPEGEARFERESDGWYVLPGGTRNYEVQIPEDQCDAVARFVIEARVDEETILGNLESSTATCR